MGTRFLLQTKHGPHSVDEISKTPMDSLKSRLRDACLEMLDSLSLMRQPFHDENTLVHRLSLLNKCYLSLVSKAEYEPSSVNLRTVDKSGDLERLRCSKSGFSAVFSKKHGVLSVSTGNDRINSKALKFARASESTAEALSEFLSSYSDYRERRCDVCLRVRNPELKYATERVTEDDYVAAYHAECLGVKEDESEFLIKSVKKA